MSGPPRVLVAPDSWGGFLGAPEVAERVVARLRQRGIPAVAHPLSDGGEGLLQTLRAHGPLGSQPVRVCDALGQARDTELGLLAAPGGPGERTAETAVVETALAIGRAGLDRLRPLDASSAGVADLLRAVRSPQLWIGLGGSATVDGGLGMLQALGLVAEDRRGEALEGPPARLLGQVRALRGLGPVLPLGEVLADVRTPLSQATARFGPQKGLAEDELGPLSQALSRWAEVLATWAQGQGRHLDPELPGGGAAGGLGLALAALGLPLRPGAATIADHTGLDAAIERADRVLTGEGRLDGSSYEGKVVGEVVTRARARGRPVLALVGRCTPEGAAGVDAVYEAREPRIQALLAAVDACAAALCAGGSCAGGP